MNPPRRIERYSHHAVDRPAVGTFALGATLYLLRFPDRSEHRIRPDL